jgi:hypothetical protein
MRKNILYGSAFYILTLIAGQTCLANTTVKRVPGFNIPQVLLTDTVPPGEVMEVVNTAINSLNNFNIEVVANLYTPNAVIADDEPPYSWNGPTAGVQWVNAVERACRENSLTKLKGAVGKVNVYQQSDGDAYLVVPVSFTGNLPGKVAFEADGAFTFVLRMINGKWMIKSQVWIPRKGM